MRRLLLASFLFTSTYISAQNLSFNCTKDTTITGCASTCLTLTSKVPDLVGNTSAYNVVTGPPAGNPCASGPAFFPNLGGTDAGLTVDDRYSDTITLPFQFRFYGVTYTKLVASTNGYLSFDITKALTFSHYQILNNAGGLSATAGNPQDLPSTLYDGALIMGAYQDINPAITTSPNRRIAYGVVGTAPYRKFVLSFYKIPQFQCNTLIENTQQIILNESSNIIEVHIYSRESCAGWNQGRAMIGIQNQNGTQAQMVPGRRASDPVWTVTSPNGSTAPTEVYSFVPVGTPSSPASPLFKRAELIDATGNIVSTASTTQNSDGTRTLEFPQTCTPVGTTVFTIKTVYTSATNAAQEIFGIDTVRVIKVGGTQTATTAAVATNCVPNGQISVNVSAGLAPYSYAIDGGNFQTSNTFTGLGQGNHIITVKDNLGCLFNYSNNVTLNNNLTLTTNADTTVCVGATFNGRVTTNATNISWSPAANVSSPTIGNPVITATRNQVYTVTGTLGTCALSRTFTVTTFPAVNVNAGPDITIVAGDAVQLNATATGATSFVWTPSAGLNSTAVLNPIASPTTTTTYTLTATDNIGCKGSDNIVITVVPFCLKPMEAFTPNGDGQNDLWLITDGRCINSAQVEVFNRYGHIVYRSANYSNNWDGTYEGKALPDGTYYFVITYQLVNNKKAQLKGNVTILR